MCYLKTVEFAQAHQAWLQRFLGLRGGIASHDTFARVFRMLDAQLLEQVLQQWLHSLSAGVSCHVAIDGKAVRSPTTACTWSAHGPAVFDAGQTTAQAFLVGVQRSITLIGWIFTPVAASWASCTHSGCPA